MIFIEMGHFLDCVNISLLCYRLSTCIKAPISHSHKPLAATDSPAAAAAEAAPSIPDDILPGLDTDDDNGSGYRCPTPSDQCPAMASPALPTDLFKLAQFRGDKSNDSSCSLTFLQHTDVYFILF